MAIKNNWHIKTLSVKAIFQLQIVMLVQLPMGEAEESDANALLSYSTVLPQSAQRLR